MSAQPMRRVEVYQGDGTTHVEVPSDTTLQQILEVVSKACNVQHECIRISINGQRAKALQEVPPEDQVVTAAVRMDEQAGVTRATEERSIPPKPVIFHQDMDGMSVVVAFDVIDNSIRANASVISFELIEEGTGVVKGLVCRDDGAGMRHELAVNHMRLAHADSGIVTAPREPNKPLAAPLFFSKELSRHGKGAAALLYFGHKVRTVTRTEEAAETVTVELDYDEWLAEFDQRGTCTYKGTCSFVTICQHAAQVSFWLPIRWCEPGMKPEQVPGNVVMDRTDRTGPAGKLSGVHRDFLMLLLYYPYVNGERTKPQLVGDAGVEVVLYTAWCGRLIPKAFSTVLPPIVAEAQQSKGHDAAWKLTASRLCAVLLCSPELHTSNHKTELLDEAYDAVVQRLGGSGREYAGEELWVWDSSKHKWCLSATASKLLAIHHKTY